MTGINRKAIQDEKREEELIDKYGLQELYELHWQLVKLTNYDSKVDALVAAVLLYTALGGPHPTKR